MDRLGQYKLKKELDASGLSSDWLASVTQATGQVRRVFLRVVNLDEVRSDQVRVLVSESKLATEVDRPRLASVLDYGRQDDKFFVAVEWIDAPSLASILRRCQFLGQRFPSRLALHTLCEIGLALADLHEGGTAGVSRRTVCYPHLNARRVLLPRGSVKLTDQVVARAFGESTGASVARDLRLYGGLFVELLGGGQDLDLSWAEDQDSELSTPALQTVIRRLTSATAKDSYESARAVVDDLRAMGYDRSVVDLERRLTRFAGVLTGQTAAGETAPSAGLRDNEPWARAERIDDDVPPLRRGGIPPSSAELRDEELPTLMQDRSRPSDTEATEDESAPGGQEIGIPKGHFLAAYRNGKLQEIILFGRDRITIGAMADNDIVLESDRVNPYHAHLTVRDEGILLVVLSGDAQVGDGRGDGGVSRSLQPEDRFSIAEYEFQIDPPTSQMAEAVKREARREPDAASNSRDGDKALVATRVLGMRPWAFLREELEAETRNYPVRGLMLCVGSDPTNDVVCDGLRPRHLVLRLGRDSVVWASQGESSADLHVNGRKVDGEVAITSGDVLQLGTREFTFVRNPQS